MTKYQIIRCIGGVLLIAGVLVFIDATLTEYAWNTATSFGVENTGLTHYLKRADEFDQQQLIGGFLTVLGAGLTLIPSHTILQKGNITDDSNSN